MIYLRYLQKVLQHKWFVFLANRDKMRLHPETRQWIEEQLGVQK